MKAPVRRVLVAMLSVATIFALAAPAAFAKGGGGGGGKGGGGRTTTTRFGVPVKVTPTGGGGYEPGITVDPFGNIYATAHKENWQLVVSPDLNSPTFTRSMSWDWMSADNGTTWKDIPGLSPASLEQHEFGDEGDMAVDDAHHLYFVDTSVNDVSFTRWTFSGRDSIAIDFTRPLLPAAQPVDDRPWVIAHGNGQVFYFGNEGDKDTYVHCPSNAGPGCGPGRYTVYASHDGGNTFDSLGYTLKDSGWCRPAADHTAGSQYVYAICGNDEGKLYSYVTSNNGTTWQRYTIGSYNTNDPYQSWPTAQVAPDGSIWALYVDAVTDKDGNVPTNTLRLFHSTNHGQTWSQQDITPVAARYEYGWISVSPTGQLGIGVYSRKDNSSPWYVFGAIFNAGSKPNLVSLDPQNPVAPADHDEAPGDLMSSAFAPDGHLSVIWTRDVYTTPVATLFRDIYYARSL